MPLDNAVDAAQLGDPLMDGYRDGVVFYREDPPLFIYYKAE